MSNIEALEHRYKLLSKDYQAGRIDEATFIAEVDTLQFQDERGRFWMIGVQSGNWHYYDGQTWQQADPRDADNLPFVDEQGRYWQRGVKSGDWYYYNADTQEWVKPGPTDPSRPFRVQGQNEPRPRTQSGPVYQTPVYSTNFTPSPGGAPQFDGELFQDEEGRYWAIGTKTGQWYFYDQNGWHPAHEFQPTGGQPYPPTPPTSAYPTQPYAAPQNPWAGSAYTPPPYQAPMPGYGYPPPQPIYPQPTPPPYPTPDAGAAPYAPVTPSAPAPTQMPAFAEPGTGQKPPAPTSDAQSGSWYYHDGKQWLKYGSGESDQTPPNDPSIVLDQEAKPVPQPKVEAKSQPVVAEFVEADEPPIEVVDVEVITVIDPEPDETPAPKPKPVAAASPEVSAPSSTLTLTGIEEVKPRRPKSTSEINPTQSPAPELEKYPRDPNRPAAPTRREGEPAVIIPPGSTTITSPVRSTRPMPIQQPPRRTRENTAPMPAVPVQPRDVTQPMPVIPAAAAARARSETMEMKAQPTPAAAPTAPVVKEAAPYTATAPIPVPVSQPQLPTAASVAAEPKKPGYTFGDVLRSFPSTIWTFAGGLVVLIIFAVVIIGAWALLNSGETSGVAVVQSPTPTLAAGPPNASPTPGPTPTNLPTTVTTPTPFTMASFESPIGFSLKYPDSWKKKEDKFYTIFSPSNEGLNPEQFKDVAFMIGVPEDKKIAITDLLNTAKKNFPTDTETLNEGTISIGSQTWTSAQIRFEDKNLGGQGIATLAVTSKDDNGYYLIAVAPAERWNPTQPTFQQMINSFRFGAAQPVAAKAVATTTLTATTAVTASGTAIASNQEKETPTAKITPTATILTTPTPKPTPTPKATATPLVYAVQSGDTLLEIANKFGVDLDLLTVKNDIDDPGKLSLGQELIIPFTAEQLAAYNGDSSASEASEEAEETQAQASGSGTPTTVSASTPPEATSEAEPEATAPTAGKSAGEAAPISGRIVYAAFNPGSSTYDLWLADVASGEQTGIASGASQPVFNKDGSLLAYRSWGLDTRGIFFRDFIGGRGGQISKYGEDGLPTWSPDGISFAFATRREGDRVPRIYRGDQTGKKDFSLNFQGEYVSTFPDGRLVAKGCLPSGDCGIFIIGASGGGETKISTETGDTAPAVSPNGQKIAFMSSSRGGSNWEIWVMDADGGNPQRLTNNGSNDGLPTWSPDGRSIAYVSDAGGVWSIWVMNADGTNQRKLFSMKGSPDGLVLHAKDVSKGWLEERISWAP
jgi:TolB protein